MPHSFGNVEYKVTQAVFFLEKLRLERELFAAQCFADAFVSSTRSITLALQASSSEILEFGTWYAPHQSALANHKLSKYFLVYRNTSIHIGETPVGIGAAKIAGGKMLFYFIRMENRVPPTDDVYTACREYFTIVLRIILDAQRSFARDYLPTQTAGCLINTLST